MQQWMPFGWNNLAEIVIFIPISSICYDDNLKCIFFLCSQGPIITVARVRRRHNLAAPHRRTRRARDETAPHTHTHTDWAQVTSVWRQLRYVNNLFIVVTIPRQARQRSSSELGNTYSNQLQFCKTFLLSRLGPLTPQDIKCVNS